MVSFKVLSIVGFVFAFASVTLATVPGGVTELSGSDLEDAQKTLQTSLTKLAAGDGPHYTISKVHSATRQVVSGSLYKFKVDLVDQNEATKECNVSIWSQPWLDNGIEVTFDCQGEEKVVRKHSA